MKRAVITGIIFAAVLSVFLIMANYSGAIFELPERTYSIEVHENGYADITETVTYKMKKPFRYVTYAIDLPAPMKIRNFKIDILQGPPVLGGISYDKKTENSISTKILFSRSMEDYIPVTDNQIIKVAFKYTVENILIEGSDFTQLFIKYVGHGTVVRTKVLNVQVSFPLNFGEPLIYHHPWGLQFKSKEIASNLYKFEFRNIPKDCFVEGRFVFPGLSQTGTDYFMKNLTLKDVKDLEALYSRRVFLYVSGSITYVLLVLLIPIFIYRKLGRENPVAYDAEYERELPYKDLPELVNSVVKTICSLPGDDAIAAAVLDSVKKGDIQFVEDGNHQITGLRILNPNSNRKTLFDAFRIFETDGVIDFKNVKKGLKNQRKAQDFLKKINQWRAEIKKNVDERKYLDSKGNVIAKTFATIFGVIIPLLSIVFLNRYYEPGFEIVNSYVSLLMILTSGIGLVIIAMRKDVFSRWSSEGLIYYLRWKNFEKFLRDFSLLSTYPPQSLAIWDDYIIYATTLGIAREVIDNLKKLYPEPPATPVARTAYINPVIIHEISSFRTIAASTVSSSSRGSGGSHGSGIGGGAGGSRVGAG